MCAFLTNNEDTVECNSYRVQGLATSCRQTRKDQQTELPRSSRSAENHNSSDDDDYDDDDDRHAGMANGNYDN